MVTTIFENSVRTLSRAQGYAQFPLVVIDHPVAYVDDGELTERARAVVAQAVELLTRRER